MATPDIDARIPFDPASSCLFFDVDGTLVDLAPHPDAVMVPDGLREDLSEASRKVGGALALVSGRTIGIIDRIFDPLRFPASGAHGAEFRFGAGEEAVRAVTGDMPAVLVERLAELPGRFQGVLVEDKQVCIAVHYRQNPAAREALLAELETIVAGVRGLALTILPGHFVFEVKRVGHDKGTAVAAFMERAPFRGRRPIFFGDDITDRRAFANMPFFKGTGVAVGQAFEEADVALAGPQAVRDWLAGVAGRTPVAA